MGKTLHNTETSRYNAADNARIATVGSLELVPVLPRPYLLFLLLLFLLFLSFPFLLFLSFLSFLFVSVLLSLSVFAPLPFAF